ncbi:GpE family phage tail protein [Sphingomonas koreensis]|nr:GpE family phage tail protein [Sphingomonas koreensis]MDC7808799.1 GpE family phage tail protein [Sphingomonas koreensis]RSU98938.1 GpE family phage tail protein [Sphingomonas koreensis]
MANLAEVWGWMPEQMERMEIADLMHWHRKMVARRPKEGKS